MILTSKGKEVVIGKFYELKYKWGDSYKYGYGWINPDYKCNKCNNVDIIIHEGGVTYQKIEDVIFIKQLLN